MLLLSSVTCENHVTHQACGRRSEDGLQKSGNATVTAKQLSDVTDVLLLFSFHLTILKLLMRTTNKEWFI